MIVDNPRVQCTWAMIGLMLACCHVILDQIHLIPLYLVTMLPCILYAHAESGSVMTEGSNVSHYDSFGIDNSGAFWRAQTHRSLR